MTPPLTRRQRQVLTFIADHVRTRGYPPTVRELADGCGFASSSSAHHHLRRLAELGWLRRDPNRTRALVVQGLAPVPSPCGPLLRAVPAHTDPVSPSSSSTTRETT